MVRGHRSGWRFISGLLTLITTALCFTVFSGTAHADAYRFWGFWQLKDGAWAFATKGPAQVTPADGSVEGWRYAISGNATGQRVPRATATFDQLCASTPAAAGKKRVGVVIDPGSANEAPNGVTPPAARGACAVVDPKATSAQVLGQVGGVREEKGLICAIDSFPSAGCGDPVKDADVPKIPSPEPKIQLQLAQPAPATTKPADKSASASASPTTDSATNADSPGDQDGGFPVWPVIVVVIIVLLAAGAFWQVRRRNAGAGSSSGSTDD
ncbi:SCO2322 family protein [Flindersiella endophytica]